jgi:hypothetical protein
MIAFIPTDISGIEVRRPRIKNEVANAEIFNLCDRSSSPDTINPDPSQMTTKKAM